MFENSQLKRKVREGFSTAAAYYDMHLSGNFRETDPREAVEAYDMLRHRLNLLGREILQQNYAEHTMQEFAEELRITLTGNFTQRDINTGIHKRKTFESCLTDIDILMDHKKTRHPDHEGLCAIATTTTHLKNWHDQQPEEHKAFFDRAALRSAHGYPLKIVRCSLYPFKLVGSLEYHRSKKRSQVAP